MRSLSRRELGRPLTPPFPRRRGARGDCEAMRVDDFDFDLPEDRIALRPASPRDSARMLVIGADAPPADVLNLTLLPMSPADIAFLDHHIGTGDLTLLSRGYGNCRITATAVPHVFWVKYFNAMDQLILDTLEVVDVPEAALAAKEDLEDSTARLEEWLLSLEDVEVAA